MSAVGVVAGRRDAEAIRAAGADYVEPTIVGNVVVEDPEEGWRADPTYAEPAAPSFAVLFPGSLRLSDPEFPDEPIVAYLRTTLAAVAAAGRPGALVVFGSGAARTVPAGVSPEAARARFAQVVVLARDIAEEHGLQLLLEPLHRGETDLINGVIEGAAFLDEFGITGVPLVADLFHIMLEGEPIDEVAALTDRVGHVHLAGDTDRRAPGLGDWPVGPFLTAMREHGYRGDVSIECRWDDLAGQLPDALAYVRAADPGV